MKIYLLRGSAGRYEDSYDWIVRAYTSYDQAHKDKEQVQKEVDNYFDRIQEEHEEYNRKLYKATSVKEEDLLDEQFKKLREELIATLTIDRNTYNDYDRTYYSVIETELIQE
jgi:hypothetical protein